MLKSIIIAMAMIFFSCHKNPVDSTPPSEISKLYVERFDRGCAFSWEDPEDMDLDHIEITYTQTSSNISHTVDVSKGIQFKTLTNLSNSDAYDFMLKTVDNTANKSEGITVQCPRIMYRVLVSYEYDATDLWLNTSGYNWFELQRDSDTAFCDISQLVYVSGGNIELFQNGSDSVSVHSDVFRKSLYNNGSLKYIPEHTFDISCGIDDHSVQSDWYYSMGKFLEDKFRSCMFVRVKRLY